MSKEYPCIYYDNMKCQKFSVDGFDSWCVREPCLYEVPSNADRLRAMPDRELAAFICGITKCEVCQFGTSSGCKVTEWLKQPAQEADDG